jgi:hypothetical protein
MQNEKKMIEWTGGFFIQIFFQIADYKSLT